jgi:hypothetical protein
MKIRCLGRCKSILTAFKKAGFKVVEVEKQDKKTVITVSPCRTKYSGKSGYATVPGANL